MAHERQQEFCAQVKHLYPEFFKNVHVLDVGSLDINGNNKCLFENCTYVGIDVGPGNNVDEVCSGHAYAAADASFDTIISTECFEHDMHYEQTITNIVRMLKPGGLFVFTCAGPGRAEHGTLRSQVQDAPLLGLMSEEWASYYKNLSAEDILSIPAMRQMNVKTCESHAWNDTYFVGFKK